MKTQWTSVDDILLAAYLHDEDTVPATAYTVLLESYEYMADDNEKLRRENRRTQRGLLIASGLGIVGWILLWVALWLLVKVWR